MWANFTSDKILRRLSSDSGFAASLSCHSDQNLTSGDEKSQLFQKFLHFIHGNVPTDFQPCKGSLLDFSSLFPAPSIIELWISENAGENLNELILFAVRSGPIQLLCALKNMGKLNASEQLINHFSALQTAVIWRNWDTLNIFGFECNEETMGIFLDSIDTDYTRNESELDWLIIAGNNCATLVERDQVFTFNFLSALIFLKSSKPADEKVWNKLLFSSLQKGHHVLADLLMCCFGADVNGRLGENDWCPAHLAASREDLTAVEMLLRRGANPNAETINHELPEELCVRTKRAKVQQAFISCRKRRIDWMKKAILDNSSIPQMTASDLNFPDEDGQTLLFLAVKQPEFSHLQTFLSIPGCPKNAQEFSSGRSLLSVAVDVKNIPAITALLEHHVSPGIRDFAGLSPLDLAVENDDQGIVQFLLSFKQCWTGLSSAMKKAKSAEISKLLQTAFQQRQLEIVKPALFAGATGDLSALNQLETGDVINVLNWEFETPAFVAAKNGQLAALEVIIELNGDFWSKHCVTLNSTLHAAAQGGFPGILRLLVSAASQKNRVLSMDDLNADGKTAVHLAVENGNIAALNALLELGASCTGFFRNGLLLKSSLEACQAVLDAYRLPRQIAIFRAIETGNLRTLRSLWMPKFDHYFRDHGGDTPIMAAAQTGNLKILEFLLESCEQEYRPCAGRINVKHDVHVENLLKHKKESVESDEQLQVFRTTVDEPDDHTQTCFQWIFGSHDRDPDESVPTLFLDEYRVNHVSATNLIDGCCAAHRAIEMGDNVRVIRKLVAKDADCINIPEHNGFTALHLAVILRRREVIKYLVTLENTDFYATDLLGRLPEELVENEKLLHLLRNSRTKRPGWWSSMCDEQLPLSTAEGLSDWTQQFSRMTSLATTAPFGSAAQIAHFAGKTSASQDGVYEYMEKNFSLKPKSNKVGCQMLSVGTATSSAVVFK